MAESKNTTNVAETWRQKHICWYCANEFKITKEEVYATCHDEFLFCECPKCKETCVLRARHLPYAVIEYADKRYLGLK